MTENQQTLAQGLEHREHAADECPIQHLARRRLTTSAYGPVRHLGCEHSAGVLTLHGSVVSFFHKQMAQEAVRDVAGVLAIRNEVQVVGRAMKPRPAGADESIDACQA